MNTGNQVKKNTLQKKREKENGRWGARRAAALLSLGAMWPGTAYATGGTLTLPFLNSIPEFLFGLTRIGGLGLMIWGVVRIGTALGKTNDSTEVTNNLWMLIGGLLIIFTKEVLASLGATF